MPRQIVDGVLAAPVPPPPPDHTKARIIALLFLLLLGLMIASSAWEARKQAGEVEEEMEVHFADEVRVSSTRHNNGHCTPALQGLLPEDRPPAACEVDCSATLQTSTGESHTFDFSTGCSEIDVFSGFDHSGHVYHVNMCRNSTTACRPAQYNVGVPFAMAVQYIDQDQPRCDMESAKEYVQSVLKLRADRNTNNTGTAGPSRLRAISRAKRADDTDVLDKLKYSRGVCGESLDDLVCCTAQCEILGVTSQQRWVLENPHSFSDGVVLEALATKRQRGDPFLYVRRLRACHSAMLTVVVVLLLLCVLCMAAARVAQDVKSCAKSVCISVALKTP